MAIFTLDEAIAYIEQFAVRPQSADEQSIPPRQRQAARFPRMRQLLAELGNPHRHYHTVHVTGTSGKGSTATMTAALLQQVVHGSVGLYTNPYVFDPRERIRINGEFVDAAIFIASAKLVQQAISRIQQHEASFLPHLKEVWVAATLVAFSIAHVEYAVIEVGMGGRFDETNIIHPDIAIITTIGYDHTEFLGPTLADIAWHKAGIVKDEVPVIAGALEDDALNATRREAELHRAPVLVLGRDFTCSVLHQAQNSIIISYHDSVREWNHLTVSLAGGHQAANAAVAIRAALEIYPELSFDQAQMALRHIWLPGRFEVISRDKSIVLDIAHNPQKMQACIATLRATMTWQRVILVFGALGTKNIVNMLGQWQEIHPLVIATAPVVAGRIASPANDIAQVAQSLGMDAVVAAAAEDAISIALQKKREGDIIIVTGSLFLVGQARKFLLTNFAQLCEIV